MRKVSFLAQVHYNQYRKGLLKVEDIKIPFIKEEVEYLIEKNKDNPFGY